MEEEENARRREKRVEGDVDIVKLLFTRSVASGAQFETQLLPRVTTHLKLGLCVTVEHGLAIPVEIVWRGMMVLVELVLIWPGMRVPFDGRRGIRLEARPDRGYMYWR